MEQFEEIYKITNLDTLAQIKARIKDCVTEPSLRWDDRMKLYRQVQLINERIYQLQNTKKQA